MYTFSGSASKLERPGKLQKTASAAEIAEPTSDDSEVLEDSDFDQEAQVGWITSAS